MQKVIHYGESKGIGVILYVNHIALEKQLDTLLPLYASWGIKGVKFGFVHVGSQQANTWLMEAVRKAAKYHLMVDIHDEYRPTGYSRTYPNLLTQEGVRGDEESPKNDVVLRTLFTRMIAGAADQTNCYFAPRVDKMGSHASQLAKAVCIYSPLQFLFWYDRPEGALLHTGEAGGTTSVIRETPELTFFDRLPTVWDDTKVLEGYPGKYITVARRKGNDWFIGCINGQEEREFNIHLDFLQKGVPYDAVIYYDDPARQTLTKVGISKIIVTSKSVIKRDILPKNGLAICLLPKR
jgi:alpha-glucosidase